MDLAPTVQFDWKEELRQSLKGGVTYSVIQNPNEGNGWRFVAEVLVEDSRIATGDGVTQEEAEQDAARRAHKYFQKMTSEREKPGLAAKIRGMVLSHDEAIEELVYRVMKRLVAAKPRGVPAWFEDIERATYQQHWHEATDIIVKTWGAPGTIRLQVRDSDASAEAFQRQHAGENIVVVMVEDITIPDKTIARTVIEAVNRVRLKLLARTVAASRAARA